jgi:hypothetical protein
MFAREVRRNSLRIHTAHESGCPISPNFFIGRCGNSRYAQPTAFDDAGRSKSLEIKVRVSAMVLHLSPIPFGNPDTNRWTGRPDPACA